MCLSKTNNISASVPIYSCHPIARSGAQLLKAFQEKPEYICTCCHRLLFWRSVAQFHVKDFIMTHSIVNTCLSHQRKTCLDSTDEEYICIRCKNSLCGKNPRCLTKHVLMVWLCMIYLKTSMIYFH